MNYYERHLGDYAKDTAHLTMIEHGAYGLLLDRYYSTEAGIPGDQVHRIARARTREEKLAVDTVLAEFFHLEDGVWINHRAEEEIAKAQVKISAAKENGKKGGRPKKNISGSENETQEKPTGLFVGSENETQKKAHQTPDTIHQTEVLKDFSGNTTLSGTKAQSERVDTPPPSPHGAMASALRPLGVSVTSANPILHQWLADGVSIDEALEAVAVARNSKPLNEPIPAKYLDAVIRGQREQQRLVTGAKSGGYPHRKNIHETRADTVSALTGRTQNKEAGHAIDGEFRTVE